MKLAAALLMSALSIPAFAHSSGSGGGGHSGGGHSGGGAHFSGGGHFSGGAHFSGGGAHFASAPHFSGGAGAHYSAPATAHNYSYGGARQVATSTHWTAPAASVGRTAGIPGGRGAPGWHGRSSGAGYGHLGHWGGGYWGGRFWPGAYYGPGFLWFLPTIPLYCATFWFNSIPYYYYNDVYYTWNPAADGYVATDPPPVATTAPQPDAAPDGAAAYADGSGSASAPDPIPPGEFAAPAAGAAATAGGSDHVFAYPTNGQTEEQQAADRSQCDQWAASQSSSQADYRRAVIACFQGRGYSAQ